WCARLRAAQSGSGRRRCRLPRPRGQLRLDGRPGRPAADRPLQRRQARGGVAVRNPAPGPVAGRRPGRLLGAVPVLGRHRHRPFGTQPCHAGASFAFGGGRARPGGEGGGIGPAHRGRCRGADLRGRGRTPLLDPAASAGARWRARAQRRAARRRGAARPLRRDAAAARAAGRSAARTLTRGDRMDLNFSPDELEFRDQVRAFIAAHLPGDIRDRVRRGDDSDVANDVRRWQKILHEHGWGAAMWPVEFGGTGWDKTRPYLFDLECAAADAPIQLPFGLKMVAPVIMRYGTPAQQARFLPRILDATDWWCQGYSEPGSGSDLASLKTRAERDGDHYVVNGQKAWNTLGQHADWIFCLVRTDPAAKPQRGISFL